LHSRLRAALAPGNSCPLSFATNDSAVTFTRRVAN